MEANSVIQHLSCISNLISTNPNFQVIPADIGRYY
jgi:hypothetical protein